ncbi:cyclodeaminase [Sneathiella limimaris]|uniref:cyclodeaminase n=1 Tax=Sneathiella limimaris TaxID=1964213 RepID=UPI00146BFA8E|nr:cyclodeaminase [Sneathiella limimaris]
MSNPVKILTEKDLREFVELDQTALDTVEQAFGLLADGKVVMPPVLSMDLPAQNGEVDIKTAYIEGFEGFAIKVSPGFFNNPSLGLASLNGLMMVLDAKTGLARAVLLDNGYLTNVRTAAAGGVAARHLAPKTVKVATVMGTGVQAELQLKAAYLARPFEKAYVWGRNEEKTKELANRLSADIKIPVMAAAEPEDAISQSQLVITTTPAETPIFKSNWLHPGLHITAMGSDQAGKNEIEASALGKADLYVADRVSQCELMGELRSALKAGVISKDGIPELGQIIQKSHPGRTDDSQITICDLTGTGAQDTAIASYALTAAARLGKGQSIDATGG